MPRSPQWSLSLWLPYQDPIHPPLLTHTRHMPILLDFITRTLLGEEYISFNSSLCSLLHSPVTSSLIGPNILLNTMFSNTLSFFFFHDVSDQVSHSYKTTGKIIVLYMERRVLPKLKAFWAVVPPPLLNSYDVSKERGAFVRTVSLFEPQLTDLILLLNMRKSCFRQLSNASGNNYRKHININ